MPVTGAPVTSTAKRPDFPVIADCCAIRPIAWATYLMVGFVERDVELRRECHWRRLDSQVDCRPITGGSPSSARVIAADGETRTATHAHATTRWQNRAKNSFLTGR
jgi:hypothetical protein